MERIKPVGHLKLTKAGKSHIPRIVRRETDTEPGEKIPFVINARTVLLYDPKMSADELTASLDVMKQDIRLRKNKRSEVRVYDDRS
jgi:hypothetical protein